MFSREIVVNDWAKYLSCRVVFIYHESDILCIPICKSKSTLSFQTFCKLLTTVRTMWQIETTTLIVPITTFAQEQNNCQSRLKILRNNPHNKYQNDEISLHLDTLTSTSCRSIWNSFVQRGNCSSIPGSGCCSVTRWI